MDEDDDQPLPQLIGQFQKEDDAKVGLLEDDAAASWIFLINFALTFGS